MATSFQQQALHRKLIYVLLIVVLFTVSLLFRGYVLEPRATELALREQSVGAVDLSGSALRLSLTGMRGVASSILWWNAKECFKKNQWDELEILTNSITKLQPHFLTPWLFQSWNLSYNVSVQCDLPRDKYFYIARGTQLLAEGERQNQDQPELRFAMGTYYQQKISNHDHKIPLQTLFELSGVDPVHRDPAWLKQPDKDGHPRVEKYFCQQYPRTARRLREKLGCTTLEHVYRYLEDNKKVPTLYGDRTEGDGDELHTPYRLNRDKPFPVLPPPEDKPYDPMAVPDLKPMDPVFDALAAARAWYQYAQGPLPPPDDKIPGDSQPIADPIHQRLPTHMTTVIFRDYPGLAQGFLGERLEDEGWFDGSGWRIPGWFKGDKFSTGEPAVVGDGREWGGGAWRDAYQMWREFGLRNHVLKTPAEDAALIEEAEKFLTKYDQQVGSVPPPLKPRDRNDPGMVASRDAAVALFGYGRTNMLTNFHHQYARAEVESRPETVAVRKALYEAEELRLAARAQALTKYEDALKRWAKVMASSEDFRSQSVCEDSFELEWNYLQLFQATPTAPLLKQQLLAQAFLGEALLPGPDLAFLPLARLARPHAVAMPVVLGPLDGVDAKGNPLLEGAAVSAVLQRKRLLTLPPSGPPTRMSPGRGAPGRPGAPGPGSSNAPAASASPR